METIKFSLDKNSYQRASFRKYLNDLRENRDLQKGALIVVSFTILVFLLGFFIKNLFFQYFLFAVGVLFIGFIVLVALGNYSTWKDGGKKFKEIFSKNKRLFFSYDSTYFIYGTDTANRRYSWQLIENMFIFPNLNMVILEDEDHDQFYLKLSNEQLEELKSITSKLGISSKSI